MGVESPVFSVVHGGNDLTMKEKADYENRLLEYKSHTREYEAKLRELTANLPHWRSSYQTLIHEHEILQVKYHESASQNANLQTQINEIQAEFQGQKLPQADEIEQRSRKKHKVGSTLSLSANSSDVVSDST